MRYDNVFIRFSLILIRFAYIEGRAFRHGDIVRINSRSNRNEIGLLIVRQEDVLAELVKRTGGFALGNLIGKGSKFGGLDIKRVYFGYGFQFLVGHMNNEMLKAIGFGTIVKCDLKLIPSLRVT